MNGKKRPNILMFMIDTQRTTNLGCYGYDKPTSPNIDKCAEEGVVFLDTISPAIWTLPSLLSTMTGLYPHSHGAGAHNDTVCDDYSTIAETLAEQGYRTMAFFANKYGEMAKKGFRETYRNPDKEYTIPQQHDLSRERVDRALRWLEQNYLKQNDPFFMYLQIFDPHLPLHPPPGFKEKFILDGTTDKDIEEINQSPFDMWAGRSNLSPRHYEILRSMLDGETAFVDSLFGTLIDFMREKKILDDTLVIVFSDHGDMLGENHRNFGIHDHFTHHLCVYEPLIKVPLIVRYPDVFPEGKLIEHSTQTLDIFPTLAEIVGFNAPFCQGVSLLSSLAESPTRTFTLTEYMKSTHVASRMLTRYEPDMDVRMYLRWLKAWRRDGWKYIWASDGRDELYNLREDSQEQTNLISDMEDRANRMRVEMENFLMTLPCGWRGDNVLTGNPSPESIQRMIALEYFHKV